MTRSAAARQKDVTGEGVEFIDCKYKLKPGDVISIKAPVRAAEIYRLISPGNF